MGTMTAVGRGQLVSLASQGLPNLCIHFGPTASVDFFKCRKANKYPFTFSIKKDVSCVFVCALHYICVEIKNGAGFSIFTLF
jgi:hypothetical protein